MLRTRPGPLPAYHWHAGRSPRAPNRRDEVVTLAVRIGFDYRVGRGARRLLRQIVPDAARTRWQQVMTDRFFMVPGISRMSGDRCRSRACPTCIGVASNRRDFGARFSL